jgi:uncharacterized Fe-S cluster protein YjdI/CDGSH-type Zn-finger protein
MTEPSPEQERGPRHDHANDAIEVHWEPKLCIHVRNCVRGLPHVFDAERRPWIDVDAADADAIAATILTCPTGALHFRRLDGGAQEEEPSAATVEPRPNGPLFVRGRVRIVDNEGRLIREDTRLALCRCGASGNKPFCDGSHRRIGFTTAPEGGRRADERSKRGGLMSEHKPGDEQHRHESPLLHEQEHKGYGDDEGEREEILEHEEDEEPETPSD